MQARKRRSRTVTIALALLMIVSSALAACTGPAPHEPPNGTFIRATDNGRVYRIAGGAPIYVSSWAAFGGEQPTTLESRVTINTYPTVPADRTFIRGNQTGRVYETIGGSPHFLTSWGAFGGPQPFINVDQAAIDHAGSGGVWIHLAKAIPTVTACPSITITVGTENGLFDIIATNATCNVAAVVGLYGTQPGVGLNYSLFGVTCHGVFVQPVGLAYTAYTCSGPYEQSFSWIWPV